MDGVKSGDENLGKSYGNSAQVDDEDACKVCYERPIDTVSVRLLYSACRMWRICVFFFGGIDSEQLVAIIVLKDHFYHIPCS